MEVSRSPSHHTMEEHGLTEIGKEHSTITDVPRKEDYDI